MIGSIVSLAEGRRRCCKSESYPKFHNPDGRSLVPEQIWEGLQKEFIGNYNTLKKNTKAKQNKKAKQISTPRTLFTIFKKNIRATFTANRTSEEQSQTSKRLRSKRLTSYLPLVTPEKSENVTLCT